MLRRVVRQLIFIGLLVGTCCFAFWRGGRAERASAVIFATAFILSLVLVFPIKLQKWGIDWTLFVIDLAILVGLGLVTARYRSPASAILVGTQIVLLMLHVAKLVDATLPLVEYRILTIALSYIQVVLLALATLLRSRALPGWLRFLSPSRAEARLTMPRR